jgi:phytanoyl-CoA hydroxylase
MTTPTANIPDQTVDEFHDRGFTSVSALLSEEEVARYRDAALRIVEHDGKEASGLTATTDAWEKDGTLRELALHPRLGAIAERLAGMPLRIWGGEVLAKRPQEATSTQLHDDLTFALLDSRITFNAWIALVDVPAERSCLTFLPGSHRRPAPERVELSRIEGSADTYLLDHWPQLAWNRRITVPLRGGDATFHQSRTAHLASANTTDQVRLAFLVTFTDADATYRPLPGSDPLPLRAGQPIPDERYPRAVRD